MKFGNYLGLVFLCFFSALTGMQPAQFNKKKDCKYLTLMGLQNKSTSDLHRYFSKTKGGFFGSDCYTFNLGVRLITDGDCKQCFGDMLAHYDGGDDFLLCKSESNNKTILHYLMNYINTNNFTEFFDYIHTIINKHPTLLKCVDGKGRLAKAMNPTLSVLELEMLNNLMENPHKMYIVPKSLFLIHLFKKEFKKAQDILERYDIENNKFLSDEINSQTKHTCAHFIVSLMDKSSFIIYYFILSRLISCDPDLSRKKDDFGLTPLQYVNTQKISEDQRLSNDQIKTLEDLLNVDSVMKKKTSLFSSIFKK